MAGLGKSIVITGASTGIGHAAASRLAGKGWRVFAGVRRAEDGERLSAELGEAITPLIMDVTDAASLNAAAEAVRAALGDAALTGLVNNAGIAVAGPLLHLSPDDLTRQLDVNVTGQVRACQAFAPLLGAGEERAGPKGRIVMMSSVSGFTAPPLLGPYAASKHALEAVTQSLRRELMLYGVDVVAINPGPIATPIWTKQEVADAERFLATDYGPAIQRITKFMKSQGDQGLPPERVAEAVERALTDATPKLNTVITGDKLTSWLLRRLPGRTADRLMTKRLGLAPASTT
jgi:NAD(P)-dependent dehydrogenase (short-subunit alcohol dehydrogenase family)